MFPFTGGVAVITGAGSGIGAALAEDLAARGCALALVDRDAAGLARAAQAARQRGVAVTEHALDIADRDAVAALPGAVLAAHGRASIVVNNAGVALIGTFEEMTEDEFDWLIGINFTGVVRMTRAFLPILKREPVASLVNVSSVYGIIAPARETAYAASKFAVRGFTEALRHEMAGGPVRVSVVHPGGIKTAIAARARVASGADKAAAAALPDYFEKLARTTPQQAAAVISAGIETGAPRILIGRDARRIVLIQRLFPVTYWRIIQAQVRRALGGNPQDLGAAPARSASGQPAMGHGGHG